MQIESVLLVPVVVPSCRIGDHRVCGPRGEHLVDERMLLVLVQREVDGDAANEAGRSRRQFVHFKPTCHFGKGILRWRVEIIKDAAFERSDF